MQQWLFDNCNTEKTTLNESDEKLDKNRYHYHEVLVKKLLQRPNNLKRINLFTTNYDMAFDYALDNLGIHYINGFMGVHNRCFRPEVYDYDLYYPGQSVTGKVHRAEKVLKYYKLHGSLSWISTKPDFSNTYRYISATMLGTIAKEDDKEKFIQGVYNFPTLDNPVWYVTEKDLIHIFDEKQNASEIEYDKDFYLPIGNSPAFSNYKVKICPDQFFVKHAAILGNTGSGKSCTLTSILRNLFKNDYNGKKLENAHIIIFDTNGEYKDAFLPEKEATIDAITAEELQQINAYYLGGDEKVKVPYWFMNWEDFNHLLNPSDATQAPVLNRAIGLAKNDISSMTSHTHSRIVVRRMQDLIDHFLDSGRNYWKIINHVMELMLAVFLKRFM